LLYPNTEQILQPKDSFLIRTDFTGGEEISIAALEIPFWDCEGVKRLAEDQLTFAQAFCSSVNFVGIEEM
jgi:hypothetical protein